MKARRSFLLLFAFSFSFLSMAGNVSVRFIDSSNGEGIEFVTVAVYSAAGNKLIKGMVTENGGNAVLTAIPHGEYILKASYVGYSKIEIPFRIAPNNSALNLGKIKMTPTTHNLKQVEVTGRKSQVKFEIDRKVYNVDQNPMVSGASVSELLRTIPSVEVAADGNVLLRNNTNVIIWINGRPSGINDENRAQLLEQMPAETIEKIEVITNPSSKYSPDGSAGIINIVLKKGVKTGRSGGFSVGGDTNGAYNGTLNCYFTNPKWEMNVNAGYRRDVRNMIFNSDRWTFNPGSDTIARYSRDNVAMKGAGFFFRGNAIWHVNQNDHLSFNGMLTSARRSVVEFVGNRRIAGKNVTGDNRSSDFPINRFMLSTSADYTHEFNKKGHELHAYLEHNRASTNGNQEVVQMDSLLVPQYYQWNHSTSANNESTVQVDYTYPFNKFSKFEFGYKGEFRTRNNIIRSWYGTIANQRVNQHELDNDFIGKDDRNSLYANYAGKTGKLKYQVGLRGEYNRLRNRSVVFNKAGNDSTIYFNNNYPGIYPSLFLDYELNADNKLQISYTRRINRPKGRMTNPFRSVVDSANIEFGNPNLIPEYSHNIELSYIKTIGEQMLSTVVYFRTTDHVIQTVNYVETQGKYDIKFITSQNTSNAQAGGLEMMLKNRLLKIFDLTTSCNLFYNHLDGFEYYGTKYSDSKNIGWSGRMIANASLPAGVAVQISGGYQSRRNIAQGETLPVWGVDAGVRKDFLKKRLVLNMTVRDLFNSRLNRDITSGYNFNDYSEYRLNMRTLGITVAYNFGGQTRKSGKIKETDNPLGGDY